MSDEEKRQRLTSAKFYEFLEELKGKVGEDKIQEVLRDKNLDRVGSGRRSGGSGVGNIGPFYSPKETFEQMDFIVAYHDVRGDNISKNEIFRRIIERHYNIVSKKAEKGDMTDDIKEQVEKIKMDRDKRRKSKQKSRKKKQTKEESKKKICVICNEASDELDKSGICPECSADFNAEENIIT